MKLSNLIIWVPRILSILLVLALYGFLFQFTPEGFEWPGFIYALIPGTVILLLTLFSWLFAKPGGILFILLGAAYAVYSYNQVSLIMLIIFSGTSIVSGLLYFLQKKHGKKVEPRPAEPEKEMKMEEKAEAEKVEEAVPKEMKAIKEAPEEPVAKEELPPLPPKVETGTEKFVTKEPPGPEAPPVSKTPGSEPSTVKAGLPAWKKREESDSLPDISLTTGSPTVSGSDLGPRSDSKNQTDASEKKTDGPSQDFMKWVEKQKLK